MTKDELDIMATSYGLDNARQLCPACGEDFSYHHLAQAFIAGYQASRTPIKWPTRDDFYKFAKISLTKQQCEAIYDWFESFVEKDKAE